MQQILSKNKYSISLAIYLYYRNTQTTLMRSNFLLKNLLSLDFANSFSPATLITKVYFENTIYFLSAIYCSDSFLNDVFKSTVV